MTVAFSAPSSRFASCRLKKLTIHRSLITPPLNIHTHRTTPNSISPSQSTVVLFIRPQPHSSPIKLAKSSHHFLLATFLTPAKLNAYQTLWTNTYSIWRSVFVYFYPPVTLYLGITQVQDGHLSSPGFKLSSRFLVCLVCRLSLLVGCSFMIVIMVYIVP